MIEICGVCGVDLPDRGFGEYFHIECSTCELYGMNGYHYGYDIIVKDRIFHFDESGYGNSESLENMYKYLKEVRDKWHEEKIHSEIHEDGEASGGGQQSLLQSPYWLSNRQDS